MEQPELQLSFDVGGAKPDKATLKLSGSVVLDAELKKGDEVYLRLINADGEPIADAQGHVSTVAFKDIRDKDGFVLGTERGHTVKLGA
jgi:hypothetical protein